MINNFSAINNRIVVLLLCYKLTLFLRQQKLKQTRGKNLGNKSKNSKKVVK